MCWSEVVGGEYALAVLINTSRYLTDFEIKKGDDRKSDVIPSGGTSFQT